MMDDIIHMHQTIWQHNATEFIKIMIKKINAHIKKMHWVFI